jgi:hypothetical protein
MKGMKDKKSNKRNDRLFHRLPIPVFIRFMFSGRNSLGLSRNAGTKKRGHPAVTPFLSLLKR